MEQIAVVLVLAAAAVLVVGMLYFSYKLLKKTQEQEKLERRSQSAEYQLHPKLKQEQQKREQQKQSQQNNEQHPK